MRLITLEQAEEVARILGLEIPEISIYDFKKRLEQITELKTQKECNDEIYNRIECARDDWRGEKDAIIDFFKCSIQDAFSSVDWKSKKNKKEVENWIRRGVEKVEMIIDDGIEIRF
jgi:hypothetical protein